MRAMPVPRLAIFAKAPRAGRVKTRLAAELGVDAALAVYRALLARTATAAADWSGAVTVHAAGDETDWAGTPLADLPRVAQAGEGLGARLRTGLDHELRQDPVAGVIAIGTDCPSIDCAALDEIARLLTRRAVVLAPAEDGGYWALGVGSHAAIDATCADELPWSRPELLTASEARCAAASLDWARGPRRADLDTLADLRRAEAAGFAWSAD